MLSCTVAEAREAQAIHDKYGKGGWNSKQRDIEGGWRFLGSGHSRWAYLAPSGTVYKVGQKSCNKAEHDAAQVLRSVPNDLVGIPQTRYYKSVGILAMEFVQGKAGIPQEDKDSYRMAIDALGIVDQWYLNFIFDGVKVWLIDLGEFAGMGMSALRSRLKVT